MSGMLWEADKQPNICEAASGFTFSTINLLIAIPMFLLDLVITTLSSILSLTYLALNPLLEYSLEFLGIVCELLGIDSVPSNQSIVMSLLACGLVYRVYQEVGPSSGGSWQQVLSKLIYYSTCVLWFLTVLQVTRFEAASSPELIYIYFAVSAASEMLNLFFKELNMFKHNVNKSEVQVSGEKYADMIKYESFWFLLLSAFGVPTLTQEDSASQYIFLVPVLAFVLMLRDVQKAAPQQPTMNGATVKETVLDKVSEPVELIEVEKPVEEPKAETIIEEPAAKEFDTAAETETEPEPVIPVVPSSEPEEPAADAPDSMNVTKVAAKDDLVVAKLVCMLTSLVGNLVNKVKVVFNPVMNLTMKCVGIVSNLPWCACITMTINNGSFILAALAWFQMTGNQLSLLLPLLSLILPALIEQAGTRIPSPYR